MDEKKYQEKYRSIWMKAFISMHPCALKVALLDYNTTSTTMQTILAKANFAVLPKHLSHAKNVKINDIFFSHIWHE